MNQRNFSGKNVERKSRANSYGFNGLNAGNIDEDDCMLGKLLLIYVNTNSNFGKTKFQREFRKLILLN